MRQPFSDEEAAQLLKDYQAHQGVRNKRTKAWRARQAELLPKMLAQLEWERWYIDTYEMPWLEAEDRGVQH